MTLQERIAAFEGAYPKWRASWPRLGREQNRDVLYATWLIGNDYRNATKFYGSYPPGYLARVMALFPEPLPTQSTENRFAVVEPFILATGSNGAPRHVDEPTPTIVGAASQSLVEPFISSYYGTQNISPVSAPIPTITTKDRFALVLPVVNGRALDIRLRMLKPHELARAMSFGDDYKFAGNQGDQVKQIGNAWGCSVGEALCEAQLVEFAPKKHQKKFTVLEAIA